MNAHQLDDSTGLEWHLTPEGWTAPGYLIRPSDLRAGSWRLESTDTRPREGSRIANASLHPSLRAAMRRARLNDQERIRRDQVRGHFVVAAGSGLLCAGFLSQMTSTGAFLIAMVFLYAAVHSFADAVSVAWGDAWNWAQDSGGPEPPGWTGRLVGAAMARLRARELEALRQRPGIRRHMGHAAIERSTVRLAAPGPSMSHHSAAS